MKDEIVKSLLEMPHQDGDRLPSIRILMQTMRAASGTVQNAIALLKAQGLVYSDPGRGTFWGQRQRVKIEVPNPDGRQTLWEKFQSDLRSGVFSSNMPLPSKKELADRYGVSPYLLERCLRDACARGFLVREGKRRYTFPKQGKKSESEILFITRSTSWGAFHPVSEREMDFLRCAYRLGAEKHYQLRLLGFDEKSGRFVDRNGCVHSLSDFPRAVGAMVSTLLVQKPLKLLNALISAVFPISVWWEHPHSDLDGTFLKKAGWMFFNSAFGKNPGIVVGKHLLQKGFSRAVYISPYHASSWSMDRLQGLKECGLDMVPCIDERHASPWDFRCLASQKGPKFSVDIRARKIEKGILKKLLKDAPTQIPWVTVNDEVAGLLRELEEEGALKEIPYLVGFDNSAESYLLRLDSFDCNTEKLVEQMFYHLELGKKDPFHNGLLREIPGKVVEK